MMARRAMLVLEDGVVYEGCSFGVKATTCCRKDKGRRSACRDGMISRR